MNINPYNISTAAILKFLQAHLSKYVKALCWCWSTHTIFTRLANGRGMVEMHSFKSCCYYSTTMHLSPIPIVHSFIHSRNHFILIRIVVDPELESWVHGKCMVLLTHPRWDASLSQGIPKGHENLKWKPYTPRKAESQSVFKQRLKTSSLNT